MSYLMSRAYYKARILLVPLGISGKDLVDSMYDCGLREVMVATPADYADGVLVREIDAKHADVSTETISERIANTDMMVFIGSKLDEVPDEFVESLTSAGRSQGTLIAGVLVKVDGWASESGSESMKALRREVDMLVTVAKLDLAQAFIEVIKGGAAEAVPGKLFHQPIVGA